MISFLKIRDVKDPIREKGNAGIDIFIPNLTVDYLKEIREKNPTLSINSEIKLKRGESVLIPSGLKSKFNEKLALIVTNKSGVAVKKKLFVGACLIDSSYQGEILIHLMNFGEDTSLNFGEKFTQLVPHYIDIENHSIETNEKGFYEEKSTRGENGFGSTGDK